MLYFLIVLSVISLSFHNKIGNYANFEIRGQTEALNYQYVVAKTYMIQLNKKKKHFFVIYIYVLRRCTFTQKFDLVEKET